jgi:hypothetical protein
MSFALEYDHCVVMSNNYYYYQNIRQSVQLFIIRESLCFRQEFRFDDIVWCNVVKPGKILNSVIFSAESRNRTSDNRIVSFIFVRRNLIFDYNISTND